MTSPSAAGFDLDRSKPYFFNVSLPFGGISHVDVDADKLATRSQRVMTDLAEAAELLAASGVVEQIHRHHEVDRTGRIERRDIRLHIPAAERLPPLFFSELNHPRRDVYARDLRCPGALEQARVKPLAAGHVQDCFPAHIAQQLEQGVLLDMLPERQVLRIPVLVGNTVVCLHRTQYNSARRG